MGVNYFRTYRDVWQSFAKISPGMSKNELISGVSNGAIAIDLHGHFGYLQVLTSA